MRLRVREIAFRETACRARLPFRFGRATLREAPLLDLRLEAEAEDGRRVIGRSASLLVPKWFEKDFDKSVEDDFDTLRASARGAARDARDLEAGTAFDLWWALDQARVEGLARDAPERLVRGFGVALVERALLDACCRAAGMDFAEALRKDLFGFEPARAFAELAGWSAARALPPEPPTTILVRHTIGFADPLTPAAPDAAAPAPDGLPACLEEEVALYGLCGFKIKLSGEPDADEARLVAVARTLRPILNAPPIVTLDANEAYAEAEELADVLDRLAEDADFDWLRSGLQAIEQPVARDATFSAGAGRGVARLRRHAPCLIDEADSGLTSFRDAQAAGYTGVSFKTCKGVFRGLLHRAEVDLGPRALFLSAEDLTNLPIVALQQDLAAVLALGLGNVERNGHHYFRGLEHLPRSSAAAALAAHPELYEPYGDGARVRIRDGRMTLDASRAAGYGYAVDDWR